MTHRIPSPLWRKASTIKDGARLSLSTKRAMVASSREAERLGISTH
ncbi:MAG TPA: hypothetical protein VK147_05440 [Candidatus Didemnitutus sp.]|nr:hypothetical protein [Candidatus Didemnitutus sp.]